MEIKKHKKSDLQQYRSIFFLSGLALAIFIVFMAFQWESVSSGIAIINMDKELVEEEMIQLIRQDKPQEIKQQTPPKPVVVAEILEIVVNETDIDDDFDLNAEVNENDKVEIVITEEPDEPVEIVFFAEEMPEFPGGEAALVKYLAKSVKYPVPALENDIQGKVYVRFIVNENGRVSNVQISKGVDPYLDKEALRVVQSLPEWKPGKQAGKAVKVWYTVPINFQIK